MGWSLVGLAWNLGLASWVWFWIRIWKCFTSAINYHLEAHCASPASRFQSWPAWLFTSLLMITLGLSLLIARTAVKWVFIRESQLPMDVFYGFQFEFILSVKNHFAMTSNEAWRVPCFTKSDPRKQSQVYKDARVTVTVPLMSFSWRFLPTNKPRNSKSRVPDFESPAHPASRQGAPLCKALQASTRLSCV